MDLLQGMTTLFAAAEAHGEEAGKAAHVGMSFAGLMIYIALVVGIIFVILSAARKGLSKRVFTNSWTHRTEHLFYFIQNMCVGIIGAHGRKYVSMMMTLWMVIFVANVVSLFFPQSPTMDLSFNLGLALVSIAYVQYEGIKSNGFVGHFSHFAGPKLPGAMAVLSVMIFAIEIVSELMKNVSLSLRIYGNIEGGHKASDAMNALGAKLFNNEYINIPFGAFLLPVKLLTCLVQALLFTLLTCVYISLVTHHEHEHDEHEDHGHDAHGHATAAAAH